MLHTDNKVDFHFLRRLRSFNMWQKMLRIFYEQWWPLPPTAWPADSIKTTVIVGTEGSKRMILSNLRSALGSLLLPLPSRD